MMLIPVISAYNFLGIDFCAMAKIPNGFYIEGGIVYRTNFQDNGLRLYDAFRPPKLQRQRYAEIQPDDIAYEYIPTPQIIDAKDILLDCFKEGLELTTAWEVNDKGFICISDSLCSDRIKFYSGMKNGAQYLIWFYADIDPINGIAILPRHVQAILNQLNPEIEQYMNIIQSRINSPDNRPYWEMVVPWVDDYF